MPLDPARLMPGKAASSRLRRVRFRDASFRWGRVLLIVMLGWTILPGEPVQAQRQSEKLGRGLVALHTDEGRVVLSWRLLADDPPDIAFEIFRSTGSAEPERVNSDSIRHTTMFVDDKVKFDEPITYLLFRSDGTPPTKPVKDGTGGGLASLTLPADVPARPYVSIPLQTPRDINPTTPQSATSMEKASTRLCFVRQAGDATTRKREPLLNRFSKPTNSTARSSGRSASAATFAREHTTRSFWYSTSTATDEPNSFAKRPTAPSMAKRSRSATQRPTTATRSYVLAGPEFLTVFDGLTGRALATTEYVPARVNVADGGDNYGNRVDRFLAGVAYLDGERPSRVMCRGYYTRSVLAAWDWRDGKLTQRWVFDSDDGTPGNRDYRGQGNHGLSVADVDDDGRDEIIYGSCVIDDDGRGLHITGLGHGDALHVFDIDPATPRLEVWAIHENERGGDRPGASLRRASSGELLFTRLAGQDVGRGLAADIDPRHPGADLWTNNGGLWNARGEPIGQRPRSTNMAIWWDGNPQRELLDGVNVAKWDYERGRETRIFSGADFRG
jgi:rhamnogalacturonan endolyase